MDPNFKKTGAPWWQEMLSRREANKKIAKIGALAALLSSASIISGCDSEDDDLEVEHDALDLQKKDGWNVGSADKAITFPSVQVEDSTGSVDWMGFREPNNLLAAYDPKNTVFKAFVVPTLVQSLSQATLKTQIFPICTPEMKEAYSRGLGMKEILKKSKVEGNPSALVISELPGPESVAFAAAMSDIADLIISFDNWPHPLGVVKSHHTLAAMIYYAKEVQNNKANRPSNPNQVIVLDKNRLNPYTDADNQFDNRYVAKIPTTDNLASYGIKGVLYAVPDENMRQELDDINDDFAVYKDKGVSVSLLPLTNFKPPDPTTAEQDKKLEGATAARGTTTTNTTVVYHYGGGLSYMPYFWMYYTFMTPRYMYPSYYRMPPASFSRPSYSPVRRPTVFSSSRVGGVSGVGKAKPSGFGRVSTRVGADGRTTGIRAGRSGSWGRSSGRSGG